MDQRDRDALLIQRAAHIRVQGHNPDAADRTGAGQDDPVGLRCQNIPRRQGMFGDKGVDGLLRPRRADAICQIEGPGDLTTEAVDIQRDAAHAGIGQRGLQLGGNPFIGGQARGLPDPGAAMDQRARDFDDGDAIHHRERLAAIALMPLGEIAPEQRGAGGQRRCGLIAASTSSPWKVMSCPVMRGPSPDRNASALAGSTIKGVLKARWAICA